MYSRTKLALKYLAYCFHAQSGKGHGIHSPFIFDFITNVLNDKTDYPEYGTVESLRRMLSADKSYLNILDLGAGTRTGNKNTRTVSSIAASAVKSKKYGQLLFRLIKYYRPATLLEIGTSLGVTTSYLSLANPEARLITLEGSPEIADKAVYNFKRLGLENISLVRGDFDQTLPELLDTISNIDFAFIDGNHRKEPTVRYFELLLPKMNNDSFIVFDDIHWGSEMEAAWGKIRTHESARCSIDLFFMGIIFFKKEFWERQDFTIRF